MVGTITDFAGRSALAQLRSSPQFKRGDYGGALLDTVSGRSSSSSKGAFFSVQSSLRSESNVFKALGDGIGKARGAIAAADAGTKELTGVLDKVDRVIGAVEAGAPGASFKSALSGLEQQANVAIARSGFGGTNLLKEGEALTITLGFKGGSNTDFRQISIEAVGLSPTDAAKQTTTVTKTVTETVETPVTRRELLEQRVEKLTTRVEKFEARETRLESRVEKLETKQVKLGERLDRLEKVEERLTNKIDEVGGNPDDPRDARRLNRAKRLAERADRLEAQGRTGRAERVQARAEGLAQRAGLTVSLDKLEKLETRLDKTQQRQVKTAEQLSNTSARIEFIGERITTFQEKAEKLTTKIESTNEKLEHLSIDKLNEVLRTKTETVEREVQVEVANEKSGGFDDLVSLVQEKLSAGDTEGAKAVVAEARARIERVQGQLGQVDSALGRRSGFLGDVSERINKSIRINVEENLDENAAARRAAQILSELAKNGRLFGGEETSEGIVSLFRGLDAEVESSGTSRFGSDDDIQPFVVAAEANVPTRSSSASGDIEPFRDGGPQLGDLRL